MSLGRIVIVEILSDRLLGYINVQFMKVTSFVNSCILTIIDIQCPRGMRYVIDIYDNDLWPCATMQFLMKRAYNMHILSFLISM